MTTRERRLAYIILAFIALAGAGFIGYQFYLQPMNAYARQLKDLDDDIERLANEKKKILADRNRLTPLAKIGLPSTPDAKPDTFLRWVPKGDAIAFIDYTNGVSNLYLQPIDGRPPRAITAFTAGGTRFAHS